MFLSMSPIVTTNFHRPQSMITNGAEQPHATLSVGDVMQRHFGRFFLQALCDIVFKTHNDCNKMDRNRLF